MLARRFTIVCLLFALFGMLFSMLVAKASRSENSWEIGELVPCVYDDGYACAPPR